MSSNAPNNSLCIYVCSNWNSVYGKNVLHRLWDLASLTNWNYALQLLLTIDSNLYLQRLYRLFIYYRT